MELEAQFKQRMRESIWIAEL